jgi:hypothetical protein
MGVSLYKKQGVSSLLGVSLKKQGDSCFLKKTPGFFSAQKTGSFF